MKKLIFIFLALLSSHTFAQQYTAYMVFVGGTPAYVYGDTYPLVRQNTITREKQVYGSSRSTVCQIAGNQFLLGPPDCVGGGWYEATTYTATCSPPNVLTNGVCGPPADPCSATQGLTTGYSNWDVVFKNVNPSPSALASFVGQTVTTPIPINGNECAATGTVSTCALFGTDLVCSLKGTSYIGATFSGQQTMFGLPQQDPNAIPGEDLTAVCPTGQYPGEVNGTQVCVKANGSANTTQSTTTNPDGTTTTTETTTACVGDKCTSTTTTTNKDGTGTTTGTSTTSTQADKDAFCTANPNAPECKNTKSSFGGSCDAGFTCESEDAVMCAIAFDQYKSNCELLKRDENLGANLASIIDDPLNELDIDTQSITRPNPPSGGGCSITPFSIQVGIASFTVDFTHLCQYLAMIKALVTAFGFVMWTLIVFVRA